MKLNGSRVLLPAVMYKVGNDHHFYGSIEKISCKIKSSEKCEPREV